MIVNLQAEWFTNKRLPRYDNLTSASLMFIVNDKFYIGYHHCNGYFYNILHSACGMNMQYTFTKDEISFWAYYTNIEILIKENEQ